VNNIVEAFNNMQDLATQNDPVDTISLDVPLLIRLFEFVREDVQTDEELHVIASNLLNASKTTNAALTMSDYNLILNPQENIQK